MAETGASGMSVAYAVGCLVREDGERPFNFRDVCDVLFGRSFTSREKAERVSHFLRIAVREGFLERVQFDDRDEGTEGVQHYILKQRREWKISEFGLAHIDPQVSGDG